MKSFTCNGQNLFSTIGTICLICLLLAGGISVYAINHKKQDVAEQSSAQTENISLDTVIIYFGNLDKNSIIVVYKIENSTN